MVSSKGFASERSADFISIDFISCLYWSPSLTLLCCCFVSRAHYRVVRSFPAIHFDVTEMSDVTLHQEAQVPLLRTGHGRNAYYIDCNHFIVQELCESRGGHPGLSVLISLLVSVDVKNY